jgi:hypothetical protein
MITKQKIQTVQEKIKQAIAKIEQEEQVSIKFGNRSYNNSMYSTKMTVTTTAQDNSTVQAVDSVNTRMSQSYGFTENIIGKKFMSTSGELTISEFKTRNRKYPIITTSEDGRSFKHTVEQIKLRLRIADNVGYND